MSTPPTTRSLLLALALIGLMASRAVGVAAEEARDSVRLHGLEIADGAMHPEGQEPPGRALTGTTVGATPLGSLSPNLSFSIDDDFDLGGYVFQGPNPLLHTLGTYNTALGLRALGAVTSGTRNAAVGFDALYSNDVGSFNTAVGKDALFSNTAGERNTAVGLDALESNSTSDLNTAIGAHALEALTDGNSNTALGYHAAVDLTSGASNTALGALAGAGWTTGSHFNIAIGIGAVGEAGESGTISIGGLDLQQKTFIEGISQTGVTGSLVFVTAADQLGVATSSARFKRDVRDLEDVSERLLALRPVSFRYKSPEGATPEESDMPIEYGLIAEEVAESFPELVLDDDQGRPFTVRYHLLTPLLLAKIQEQEEEIARLGRLSDELGELRRIVADQRRTLEALLGQAR